MCGRYQFSTAEYKDFDAIVRDAQRRSGHNELNFQMAGDYSPSQILPVIISNGGRVVGDFQKWGIPGWRGGTIINARAETVTQKPMFKRSILAQRCVVPATGYYEWDSGKHKYFFQIPGKPLYLAGIYDVVDDMNCFVILTTAPNESVQGIHDRMPLILARDQIRPWLTDNAAALELLTITPPVLERVAADGQISFQDLNC